MNTTYFLNLLAGNVFGTKKSPAIPTVYYVGMSSTAPKADGTGATELPASGGYARIQLTNLGQPSNGEVRNTANISFPESTTDWGTMTHFLVYDAMAVGSGHLLMYGELDTPRRMEPATIMTFPVGKLRLSAVNPT